MKEFDPVYQEVGERLRRLGVEAVLFDLDDTLIYTSEIFIEYMQEFIETVAETKEISKEGLMKKLEEINNDEYKKMGVNPVRWAAVVDRLAKDFPEHKEIIVDNLEILMKIYSKEPRMREGARINLEVLRGAGIKMGLVTHANVEWTHFKLDILGLWNYFDCVHIVDENGHKKSEDWEKASKNLGVEEMSRCLVVGDSLSGDIRPGAELGARTIWIPSPWSVSRQGQVPEDTVKIEEIRDLFAGIEALR